MKTDVEIRAALKQQHACCSPREVAAVRSLMPPDDARVTLIDNVFNHPEGRRLLLAAIVAVYPRASAHFAETNEALVEPGLRALLKGESDARPA